MDNKNNKAMTYNYLNIFLLKFILISYRNRKKYLLRLNKNNKIF